MSIIYFTYNKQRIILPLCRMEKGKQEMERKYRPERRSGSWGAPGGKGNSNEGENREDGETGKMGKSRMGKSA